MILLLSAPRRYTRFESASSTIRRQQEVGGSQTKRNRLATTVLQGEWSWQRVRSSRSIAASSSGRRAREDSCPGPSMRAMLADDWHEPPFSCEVVMACNPQELKHVPLFALLDDEETAVLAAQVELKRFAPRERIYKTGDEGGRAYVMVSGRVRVTTIDQDHQEVVVDEPGHGEFFGFASMLEGTPHQTDALALEEATCLEVDRKDIAVLLERKPLAGMDMLTVLGRQFHAPQQLVRVRASRNPNVIIETAATVGERVADQVARFGGSWTFITLFAIVVAIYTA